MKIHIISTVNGLENEGMRNVATHLSKCFEKDNTVQYSSLKDIHKIVKNSLHCDVTFIFARTNMKVYYICRLVSLLCKNVYLVLVQKPQQDFLAKCNKHELKCGYFTLSPDDANEINLTSGKHVYKLNAGINKEKFCPASKDEIMALREKYGVDKNKPLIVHVGHCSAGRGLEDFSLLDAEKYERMVVASGMFENPEIINTLKNSGVNLHTGYLPNINEIYQMADVYLFPTRSTEFVISIPLSVMEALSCGTPVVAYDSFKNIKLIETNDQGAIRTIKESQELANAIDDTCRYKRNQSYLSEPLTWDDAANMVLETVKEQLI